MRCGRLCVILHIWGLITQDTPCELVAQKMQKLGVGPTKGSVSDDTNAADQHASRNRNRKSARDEKADLWGRTGFGNCRRIGGEQGVGLLRQRRPQGLEGLRGEGRAVSNANARDRLHHKLNVLSERINRFFAVGFILQIKKETRPAVGVIQLSQIFQKTAPNSPIRHAVAASQRRTA